MSLKKSELIDKNLYELTIGIEKDVFDAAVDKVYRRSVKNINVPGFRRGKAPKAIIQKMYGTGVFYEDAVNDLIPDAYTEALKESGIDAVSQPEFDIDTIDENGVVLKAKVYVKPEVKIEGYEGIAVERDYVPATDAEIDADIAAVQDRNSRMIEITDRTAENGDTVNIDFEGFSDGVAFEGGKAEGHELILGSGQFIPGFEDQIVGHSVGDNFDVNVSFPEEYHAEELAGKPAVFKCKLNTISKKELPALDDEFARDVSEFDTFAEYKADVEAKINERKTRAADNAVEEKLLEALVEKMEADIPDAMYVTETENFVRDYDNRLRMQGLDLNTYFKYTGMNLDALREQMRPQAERQVKSRLALEGVAAAEKIDVTDEEIDAEYARLSEVYGMEADKIKDMIDKADIAADIKVKKAMDLVKEKASITEVGGKKKAPAKKAAKKSDDAEAAEESPAKKPAAKKAPAKKTAKKADDAEEAPAEKSAAKKTSAKKSDNKDENASAE